VVDATGVPMKRKIQPKPEPVIPEDLLELAKQSICTDRLTDRLKKAPCSVCGAESAVVASGEPLCWVCRRLKISAWREIEQQMPMQE
jgi:hypothetical protein